MRTQTVKSSIMVAGLTRGVWMGATAGLGLDRRTNVGGTYSTARRQRVARRFFVSLLRRYVRDAAEVLQRWADELEGLAE